MMGGFMIRKKEGQAMVEFALVLPILILILFGIFEFGMIFNSYLTINAASREGARVASVGADDAEIASTVVNFTPTLDSSNISVAVTPDDTIRTHGDSAKVSVDYVHSVNTPIIRNIISNTITLHAETTMRVE